MIFEDYQFKTNPVIKICFWLLAVISGIVTISMLIFLIQVLITGFTEGDIIVFFAICFLTLFYGIIMATMKNKRLVIYKDRIERYSIFKRRTIYEYLPTHLLIKVSYTFAWNRGIKLTFIFRNKKLFSYVLLESVTSYRKSRLRRQQWKEQLGKIGCVIYDPGLNLS